MYDRILVATDGSDGAAVATTYALALATASDATLDVVHVLDQGGPLASLLSDEDEAATEAQGRDLLEETAARAEDAGVAVETHLRRGDAHAAILETAAEQDADLLVLGRHGRRGLRDRLLGSVTDRVLRKADRPVLTVRGDGPTAVGDVALDRLLLTTDGSERSEVAFGPAADLASLLGAAVEVLSVVDVQAEAGPFDAGGVDSEFIEALEELAQKGLDRAVDEIEATDPGVEATTTIARGRATAEIATHAEDADLVVMSRTGHSRLAKGLLGSTTDRVLRTVEQPVLVVGS